MNPPDEYELAAAEDETCPTCGAPMRHDAVLCVQCGYHRQKGVQMATVRDDTAPPPAPTKYTDPGDNPYASPVQADDERQQQHFQRSDESEPVWEGGGTVGSYLATTWAIFSDPFRTFGNMVMGGSYGPPISYVLITYFLATGVNFVYQVAIGGMFAGLAGSGDLGRSCCAAICLPVLLLIWSCILHGVLYLTGPLRGDFDTTFRVVAYCDGATRLLLIVPIVGVFLHQLATLVYNIIGLSCAHQISAWRAALAVVTIFLLWIALVIVLVIFLISRQGFPEPG